MIKLFQDEELKFYQRAKVTNVLLWDNTRYFQMDANGKHSDKRISAKIMMTEKYKARLTSMPTSHGRSTRTCLDQHKRISCPEIRCEKMIFLKLPKLKMISHGFFCRKGDLGHNKALRPDGYPAEFYQRFWDSTEFYQMFWDVIKADLMQMFHDLYSRTLSLLSLNFGVTTLILKV